MIPHAFCGKKSSRRKRFRDKSRRRIRVFKCCKMRGAGEKEVHRLWQQTPASPAACWQISRQPSILHLIFSHHWAHSARIISHLSLYTRCKETRLRGQASTCTAIGTHIVRSNSPNNPGVHAYTSDQDSPAFSASQHIKLVVRPTVDKGRIRTLQETSTTSLLIVPAERKDGMHTSVSFCPTVLLERPSPVTRNAMTPTAHINSTPITLHCITLKC